MQIRPSFANCLPRIGRRALPLIALLGLLAIDASRPSVGGDLYFSMDRNANGLYRIDTATGLATLVGAGISGVTGATVGLTESGDPDFLFGSRWSTLLRIASDGSGSADLGGDGTEALAYDPTTDTLYGAANGDFFTMDQSTGMILTILAAPGADVEGLAYLNGRIYGLDDKVDSILRSYDPSTDTWTVIGGTGLGFDDSGLAADPVRGVLYAIGERGSGIIYELNPATAVPTAIGDTGIANPTGGLAFVSLPVQPGVSLPPVSRPDVSVSLPPRASVGKGVFSPAAQRLRTVEKRPRFAVRFDISSAAGNGRFSGAARVSRVPGAKVVFRSGGANVTGALLAGKWTSPALVPGQSASVSASVSIRPSSDSRRLAVGLRAKSQQQPFLADSATAAITLKRHSPPASPTLFPRVPLRR